MTRQNIAYTTLWPCDTRTVLRVCFLYVGQGESVLVLARDGADYRVLLVDSNLDEKNGGIDIPILLKDLLPSGELHAFVNTHPHDDHLHGIKEIDDAVQIMNVWHSGHRPSKEHGTYHPDLKTVIDSVSKTRGEDAVTELKGSDTAEALFDAEVHFLAPREKVNDEINNEPADTRYRRIHENCAVIKFGTGKSWILVTGDADLVAFRDHITTHHKNHLSSFVLDASHHGSRSFFMKDKGDDPYLAALEAIAPDYVVVSAPTVAESPHEHPHADAVQLYEKQVGPSNVLHTGEERKSYFFDIYDDGTHSEAQDDDGKLAEEYGLDKKHDGGGGGGVKSDSRGPFARPQDAGEYVPRKYAMGSHRSDA